MIIWVCSIKRFEDPCRSVPWDLSAVSSGILAYSTPALAPVALAQILVALLRLVLEWSIPVLGCSLAVLVCIAAVPWFLALAVIAGLEKVLPLFLPRSSSSPWVKRRRGLCLHIFRHRKGQYALHKSRLTIFTAHVGSVFQQSKVKGSLSNDVIFYHIWVPDLHVHVGITSGDHAEGLTKGGVLASALADGGFVFVSSEQDLDVGILG